MYSVNVTVRVKCVQGQPFDRWIISFCVPFGGGRCAFFSVGFVDCAGVGGGGWELLSVELVAAELVAAELVELVAAELVAAELVAAELVAVELVAELVVELVVAVEVWRVVDLRIGE